MFRSTSLRLAGLYTAVFALSVLVLGTVTFFSLRQALSEQFDARIRRWRLSPGLAPSAVND